MPEPTTDPTTEPTTPPVEPTEPPTELTDPPGGDTFPRAYVEELREESARHRTAAKEAREALQPVQERLHLALTAATGRLADPTDLPFDPAHLEDDALSAAIDALLEAKPHLASRRVSGDVGQGTGQGGATEVNLGSLLRARA